jgi:hypothetical protein
LEIFNQGIRLVGILFSEIQRSGKVGLEIKLWKFAVGSDNLDGNLMLEIQY